MKVEINSLYWNNSQELAEHQQRVMQHFSIPVNYYNIDGADHGSWIDYVMENSTSDIVGILDADCVPVNKEIIEISLNYVAKHKSVVGLAQCANHIFPYSHVCAAAVFYFIYRDTWVSLGKPSFRPNVRGDVSEEISWLLEENRIPYKAIYPTHFEREPVEGVWRLGNYGYFGIGTVFGNNDIYHLYQGRLNNNTELFKQRCDDIIAGTFNTTGMFSCTSEYEGNICR